MTDLFLVIREKSKYAADLLAFLLVGFCSFCSRNSSRIRMLPPRPSASTHKLNTLVKRKEATRHKALHHVPRTQEGNYGRKTSKLCSVSSMFHMKTIILTINLTLSEELCFSVVRSTELCDDEKRGAWSRLPPPPWDRTAKPSDGKQLVYSMTWRLLRKCCVSCWHHFNTFYSFCYYFWQK